MVQKRTETGNPKEVGHSLDEQGNLIKQDLHQPKFAVDALSHRPVDKVLMLFTFFSLSFSRIVVNQCVDLL